MAPAAFAGTDGDGREFQSPDQLWSHAQDTDGSHTSWYQKAVAYWDQQEPTYNGVLGGFGFVSDVDIRDSRLMIEKVMKAQFQQAAAGTRSLVALDCGAGVGRVANELLLHLFQEVDLLEPSQPLLDSARKNLSTKQHQGGNRTVNFFCAGLQEHSFEAGRYDCIWIQWCLLYITDADVPTMLSRACQGLKPDGVIVVKENVCKEGFVVDNDDSSLTRSNAYMLELFEKSNLQLLQSAKQRNFPKDLFDVRIYVLRPKP